MNRLSRGLWLQLCGYLCFSGFPFLIIWPRDSDFPHGLCQFSHGLHPLTYPVLGSWPEIDMTKDAPPPPQDPLSPMVFFKAQCSESPLSLSILIALCLCVLSMFSCLVGTWWKSLFTFFLQLYCNILAIFLQPRYQSIGVLLSP